MNRCVVFAVGVPDGEEGSGGSSRSFLRRSSAAGSFQEFRAQDSVEEEDCFEALRKQLPESSCFEGPSGQTPESPLQSRPASPLKARTRTKTSVPCRQAGNLDVDELCFGMAALVCAGKSQRDRISSVSPSSSRCESSYPRTPARAARKRSTSGGSLESGRRCYSEGEDLCYSDFSSPEHSARAPPGAPEPSEASEDCGSADLSDSGDESVPPVDHGLSSVATPQSSGGLAGASFTPGSATRGLPRGSTTGRSCGGRGFSTAQRFSTPFLTPFSCSAKRGRAEVSDGSDSEAARDPLKSRRFRRLSGGETGRFGVASGAARTLEFEEDGGRGVLHLNT